MRYELEIFLERLKCLKITFAKRLKTQAFHKSASVSLAVIVIDPSSKNSQFKNTFLYAKLGKDCFWRLVQSVFQGPS